jgi:hypothetical protein
MSADVATKRPEGRYRVRFLKDAATASPEDPHGGAHPRAGDEWTLLWLPALDPAGDVCYEHFDRVGKPPQQVRAHAEANRHPGSWWTSYVDGAYVFSACQVEVLAGPL